MQFNAAAETFCFKQGHNFKTYDEGKPFADPVTKQLLVPKVTRCSQCGMTPEHVFRYQVTPKGKAKPHVRSDSRGEAAPQSPEN